MQISLFFTVISSILFSLPFVQAAGKRGACWAWYNGSLNPGKLHKNKVSYIYDYETYQPPSTNGAGGLEFIGMQRCLDCDSSPIGQLKARLNDQKWKKLFTLNEPDINGISPASAATWYKKNITPLKVAKAFPAVTNSNAAGQGLNWLRQFISACNGKCPAKWINLHWYGATLNDFKAHVQNAHKQFPSYKIAITEFALNKPAGGQQAQINFYTKAFAWLDSQAYVEMYFPFIATTPNLLKANDANAANNVVGTGSCLYNNDGTLSKVGQLFTKA
ncbi:glycoside hydrolase family 128 protein [Atractiella rhizophila]|nr:glycoside hydrolase family 128 protein [Atractiella rhizophila]